MTAKKPAPKNPALKAKLKSKQMSDNLASKVAKETKKPGAGRKKK